MVRRVKVIVIVVCLVLALGLALGVGLGVGLNAKDKNDTDNVVEEASSSTGPPDVIVNPSNVTSSISLSSSDLVSNWTNSKSWNIVSVQKNSKELISLDSDGNLRAFYPKGSYKPSASPQGGFQFYSIPTLVNGSTTTPLFGAKEACVHYQVMFPSGFEFVKGGKLPGFWIGSTGGNGGNHIDDGASVRLMWRKDGDAEAYVYTPTEPKQLDAYSKIPGFKAGNPTGDSLWRSEFKFKTGSWNTVKLYLKINSITTTGFQYDGVITLEINGVKRSFNQMVWTNDVSVMISGLMLQTFFGGSDSTWASPKDQYVHFKDFFTANVASDCSL